MIDLDRHIGSRRKVRLRRSVDTRTYIHGYITAASDELVLVHPFHDFMPDGYWVIRRDDIEELRSGPYERHWDTMLANEGLLGGLDVPIEPDLSSFRSAIETIAMRSRLMIVECEEEGDGDTDFYIGHPVAVEETSMLFRHFDGLGVWEPVPHVVALDEITKIQFATPYIQHFSKYLREPPVSGPP